MEYTPFFFTVPKKKGDWRVILDLKFLNRYNKLRHFRMEASEWRLITEALQPKEYQSSIDLTEVYLQVPIFSPHRRFLWFCVGKFDLQYRAHSFRLSTAPRVFLRTLTNPVIHLREQGKNIHPYLDNLLIRLSSRTKSHHNIEMTVHCVQAHGFIINIQKSPLQPVQRLQHPILFGTPEPAVFREEKARKIKDISESSEVNHLH